MQIHDLIIIGSGPAGLSAAIYAKRAQLDTLVIEKNMMSGGQILNTYEVDNYPGLPGISGFDLGQKMREHADRLEAVFVEDTVIRTELKGKVKKVIGENGTYEAKTVIIAAGAHYRTLGVKGEEPLTGAGVVTHIITELCVLHVPPEGLVLEELAPDVTVEEVVSKTDAELIIPEKIGSMI